MSDQIKRLRQAAAFIANATGAENARWIYEAADEIERMRAALESLTKDPPATLDEPDTDAEVVQKMRAIARATLALSSKEEK